MSTWYVILYFAAMPVQFGPFATFKQCNLVQETMVGKELLDPRYQFTASPLRSSGCWEIKGRKGMP